MERRELKYLLNHQKEIKDIIKKYDFNNKENIEKAANEIQDILMIDIEYVKRNNCSEKFIEILRLILRRQRFLEKEEIFDYLAYVDCVIDMITIYENELMQEI